MVKILYQVKKYASKYAPVWWQVICVQNHLQLALIQEGKTVFLIVHVKGVIGSFITWYTHKRSLERGWQDKSEVPCQNGTDVATSDLKFTLKLLQQNYTRPVPYIL